MQTRGSGLNAFEVLYLVGFILFVFTLLLNIVSERFVRRVAEALLMAVAHARGATRSTVRARTRRGKRSDVSGADLRRAPAACLLVSLGVLLVLLASVLADAGRCCPSAGSAS